MNPYTTKCHRCGFEFLVSSDKPTWRREGYCSINCKEFFLGRVPVESLTTTETHDDPPVKVGWISTEDVTNNSWNPSDYLTDLVSDPHTDTWEGIPIHGRIAPKAKENKIRDLDLLQQKHAKWTFKNFGRKLGPERCLQPLAGVTEEAGELAHAILKLTQGIRNDEPHYEDGQDAIGDVVMYLLDICTRMGWSFNDCLVKAWDTIEKRDWTEEREEVDA